MNSFTIVLRNKMAIRISGLALLQENKPLFTMLFDSDASFVFNVGITSQSLKMYSPDDILLVPNIF